MIPSPSLFIIASEVLSRGLKKLAATKQTIAYSVPGNCPKITHLAFVDDVIIFTNGSKVSSSNLMKFLGQYKTESCHLVNKQKSCFVTREKATASGAQTVASVTGYSQKSLPLKYLGCNLFVGRKKIQYFVELIANIEKKLSGWKSKMLSYGG